jgi:hypothetical protein
MGDDGLTCAVCKSEIQPHETAVQDESGRTVHLRCIRADGDESSVRARRARSAE